MLKSILLMNIGAGGLSEVIPSPMPIPENYPSKRSAASTDSRQLRETEPVGSRDEVGAVVKRTFESARGSISGKRSAEAKPVAKNDVAEETASEISANADRVLVERAKGGDLDAFRSLVEKYQARAHSIAMGVISNRDDAEDIVQDAFLKAYRNLASFRGQSSFYTWFYRIVFNLAIDLSRKRYRRSESSLGDDGTLDALNLHSSEDSGNLLGSVPTPDQVLNRNDIAAGIRKAIEGLSAEHRAVIVLREIEGLSYTEISEVVGCSKGTVMSRLHHARKRLQRSLADFMPWKGEKRAAAGTEAIEEIEDDEDSLEPSPR